MTTEKQSSDLDGKYLKISCIMIVYGIASLLTHGLILTHVPDLGHTTADSFTKFLNSLMGFLGFGGMFTLYMSAPFFIRAFRKSNGMFLIMIFVAVPIYWMFAGLLLMAGWQKVLEMFL